MRVNHIHTYAEHIYPSREASSVPSTPHPLNVQLSMERVRPGNNHRSPPSISDSATPFSQADPFLLTQNGRGFDPEETMLNLQYREKPRFSTPQSLYPNFAGLSVYPLRLKPLLQGFEEPCLARIVILTALCLAAYPAFYVLTLVARDKSLFTVRLIVAMWCSGVGFVLGCVLLRIAARHLEAASE